MVARPLPPVVGDGRTTRLTCCIPFAVMGPQFIAEYVPGYIAKPSDRIIGAAKVELLRWADRDADWLTP